LQIIASRLQRNKMPSWSAGACRSPRAPSGENGSTSSDRRLGHLVMIYKHCPRIGYDGIRRIATHNPVSTAPTKKPRRNAALSQQSLAGDYSMIRKSGYRFSLATNAERVCAGIMFKSKELERDDDVIAL